MHNTIMNAVRKYKDIEDDNIEEEREQDENIEDDNRGKEQK